MWSRRDKSDWEEQAFSDLTKGLPLSCLMFLSLHLSTGRAGLIPMVYIFGLIMAPLAFGPGNETRRDLKPSALAYESRIRSEFLGGHLFAGCTELPSPDRRMTRQRWLGRRVWRAEVSGGRAEFWMVVPLQLQSTGRGVPSFSKTGKPKECAQLLTQRMIGAHPGILKTKSHLSGVIMLTVSGGYQSQKHVAFSL